MKGEIVKWEMTKEVDSKGGFYFLVPNIMGGAMFRDEGEAKKFLATLQGKSYKDVMEEIQEWNKRLSELALASFRHEAG